MRRHKNGLLSDGTVRSQKHVAGILGMTRGGVAVAERRALRKIREGLAKYPDIQEWLQEQGRGGVR